jgi:hypothetical protein
LLIFAGSNNQIDQISDSNMYFSHQLNPNRSIMKKLIGIALVTFLIAFSGCGTNKKMKAQIPEVVIQNHAEAPHIFKAGSYYAYDFQSKIAYVFDEKEIIGRLRKEKVAITDIWNKYGASSCAPPGSDIAMTVIVEPVFLIRLEKKDDRLLAMGFAPVDEPSTGDCAYAVRYFKFR